MPSPQRPPVAVECGDKTPKELHHLVIGAPIRLGSTNEVLQTAPQADKLTSPRSSSGKYLSHVPISGLRSISYLHILFTTPGGYDPVIILAAVVDVAIGGMESL